MSDLTETDRKVLWEQFVIEHRKAYEMLDGSVRTLAAGGIGLTVSLATALKTISPAGVWAVGLFIGSLGLNVLSFVGVTLDMRARLNALKEKTGYAGTERSGWTRWISVANVLAAAALIAGSVLLLIFIERHAKG